MFSATMASTKQMLLLVAVMSIYYFAVVEGKKAVQTRFRGPRNVQTGSNFTLECKIVPPKWGQWYKNGRRLRIDGKHLRVWNRMWRREAMFSHLKVTNAKASDSGEYMCYRRTAKHKVTVKDTAAPIRATKRPERPPPLAEALHLDNGESTVTTLAMTTAEENMQQVTDADQERPQRIGRVAINPGLQIESLQLSPDYVLTKKDPCSIEALSKIFRSKSTRDLPRYRKHCIPNDQKTNHTYWFFLQLAAIGWSPSPPDITTTQLPPLVATTDDGQPCEKANFSNSDALFREIMQGFDGRRLRSQRAESAFKLLLEDEPTCRRNVRYLLYQIHGPEETCRGRRLTPVPPCRTFCEDVQFDCGLYFVKGWPRQLSCESLPDGDGACIQDARSYPDKIECHPIVNATHLCLFNHDHHEADYYNDNNEESTSSLETNDNMEDLVVLKGTVMEISENTDNKQNETDEMYDGDSDEMDDTIRKATTTREILTTPMTSSATTRTTTEPTTTESKKHRNPYAPYETYTCRKSLLGIRWRDEMAPHADCTKYWLCSNGAPNVMTCPPGTVWNFISDRCDWPINTPYKNRKCELKAARQQPKPPRQKETSVLDKIEDKLEELAAGRARGGVGSNTRHAGKANDLVHVTTDATLPTFKYVRDDIKMQQAVHILIPRTGGDYEEEIEIS